MQKIEQWQDIPNYEDLYQASISGKIRSLDRKSIDNRDIKGLVIKQFLDNNGYLRLKLYKNGKQKTFRVHQLIAMTYHNHTVNKLKEVVDHIDNNKLNNHKDNLRIVSMRVNGDKKHLKSTSKYTGVDWYKRLNKWRASIQINGKLKHLGLFENEYEAHLSYEKELNNHLKGSL